MNVIASELIRKKLLEKYRTTTRDRVERLNLATLNLFIGKEREAAGRELAHELHTIKGEAKLMGFPQVSELAHGIEGLVLAIAEDPKKSDDKARDTILGTLDRILLLADPANSAVDAPKPEAAAFAVPSRTQSLRIDVRQLDELTELVGAISMTLGHGEHSIRECLAILRGLGDDSPAAAVIPVLQALSEHALNNRDNVGELELRVRSLRLMSLSGLFDLYPRAVHDIAQDLGKQVRVEIIGADVEIDKNVFEALGEPLVHLIRNAVDHGIETPDERRAQGKDPRAVITLSAEQRGGWAEIEVRDDGCGICPSRVRRTAVDRGVATSSEVAARNDTQVMSYLFAPGFTTRSTVTDISGRGIGLDIVRERIEGMGSSVRVTSIAGQGATFVLRVPISVVVLQTMLVESRGHYFALSADAVDAMVRAEPDDVRKDASGYLLDVGDGFVRYKSLAAVLDETQEPPPATGPVLVVQSQHTRVAYAVDRLLGERRFVQRSMDPFCEGLRLFSGTSVMNDGSIVLLLNATELVGASDPLDVPHRVTNGRVLLVDDSDVTRQLVASQFAKAGYFVEEARTGRDALERLNAHTPDIIISDLDMPELDGFGLLEHLRRHDAFQSIPVVVFSSRQHEADRQRAHDLGAEAYVIKERDDVLLSTVARIMDGGAV